MSLLEVSHLSHIYGDKILYQDAEFSLYKGEHMGIVGQNGAGKSTLISILTGQVIPDEGSIKWQPNIRTGWLDQHAETDAESTILDCLQSAFVKLYRLEQKVQHWYDRYASEQKEEYLLKASDGQTQLEAQDFYTIDTRIEKVMNGLGLSALGANRLLGELSGGQRAKVILAKLLLEQPDVLLLDEPTNYLDKEHVSWLTDYLSGFPNAFLVVSHNFEFLEEVTTCICDIETQTIRKYHGKYSEFLKQKEHLKEDHIRRYTAQQKMIQQTEEFIRKNIAGNNSKNAKGRRKQLSHITRITAPDYSTKPTLQFSEKPATASKPLIVENLEVGYEKPLLPKLSFSIMEGEKMVITGFNGIGKSTLLKTLVREIPSLAGSFAFSNQITAGYYQQELAWKDKNDTPLQIISAAYPKLSEKQVFKALASCGIKDDHFRQPVGTLSGGEQSKVKLCRLMLSPCNFLILDEPTSHLDANTREALQDALIRFGGSVILVSHEESFYRGWADKIFQIEQGRFC